MHGIITMHSFSFSKTSLVNIRLCTFRKKSKKIGQLLLEIRLARLSDSSSIIFSDPIKLILCMLVSIASICATSAFAQSYVDQQVQLANKVKRDVLEGMSRDEAHVADMEEIGNKVWKSHFEVLFNAIEDCKTSNSISIKSKNYVAQDAKQITKFANKFMEEIQRFHNSTSRLYEIFKRSEKSACYVGYEKNLEAYIDCMHTHYRTSAALSKTLGVSIMLKQFEILKVKSDEYIQCSIQKNYINDYYLESIANSIDISGEFYVDMARRFSKEADAIR